MIGKWFRSWRKGKKPNVTIAKPKEPRPVPSCPHCGAPPEYVFWKGREHSDWSMPDGSNWSTNIDIYGCKRCARPYMGDYIYKIFYG